MADITDKSLTIPRKVIFSLRFGAVFFALANILCVAIIASSFLAVKLVPKTLSVTGSARKAIVSDLVTWAGTIRANDAELGKAYATLKTNSEKVKAFLLANGIAESDITFSAINTARRFKQEILSAPAPAAGAPAAAPAIVTTDKVEMYTLTQTVSISSGDMTKVPAVSRLVTSLIQDGVEIDSEAPRYLYTKLSELKINMLAEATKDATSRAEQIVNNAKGHLGKLVDARMGVMQINPKGISATSSEGNNDTTSYEKEITSIVSVSFEVR